MNFVRYASSKTQLPPPDPKRRKIPRKTFLPPEKTIIEEGKTERIGKHGISPVELKMRRRKFVIVSVGLYLVFVGGAYYYLTYGIASDAGQYKDAETRDTRAIYEDLAERYDSIINRDEQFMFLPFWRKDVTKQLTVGHSC